MSPCSQAEKLWLWLEHGTGEVGNVREKVTTDHRAGKCRGHRVGGGVLWLVWFLFLLLERGSVLFRARLKFPV